jgi:DNA gyrase subunit A
MPLRRLTRFSTLELETERDGLMAKIAELTAILDSPEELRALVGNQLAEIAQQHGTPRRTILLAASGVAATVAAEGPRANHDVIVSAIVGTARGECGLVTSAGRLIKINAIDLPTVPTTANMPNLQGGTHVSELITLEPEERVLCLTTLATDSPGLALGTAQGVVKRVNPEVLGRDSWEVIRLDPGDRVVGAVELTSTAVELTFLTNDAQLLHFPASSVRPQGRSGGGMAGIKLGIGARVVFFGAVPADGSVVVTVAGTSRALPGTDAGTVKVTPFAEYPGKGRATGGVRCHRFLKGEDALLLGWAGPAPAYAAAASGSPIDLPAAEGRRDGSGITAGQPIAMVSSPRG